MNNIDTNCSSVYINFQLLLLNFYFVNILIIGLLSKCRIENQAINRTELVMNFLVHTIGIFIYIQYIYYFKH